ncbi:hypothetical protein LLE49_09070 [Alicyclobacillus tolerans]|uniref:hypothetical protein n=1 Tax=Alicyclobacillus tolerans TaxID=90970 RepID=UPI001F4440A8|nr:hypothetical protein [Alicyclobacillus tolerans]MCF8564868.1 hypothetical protein [Alicyclobacillus tolerans]
MAISKDELHRLVDHLPPEKLLVLEEILNQLVGGDNELITGELEELSQRVTDGC